MTSSVFQRAMPWLASGLAIAALLGGCASAGRLPPDATLEAARHGPITPNAEYPLPGGGTRLEFAHGGWSKTTYMLDFDASGHLLSQQQVLTQAKFANIVPGMTEAEVRFRLGKPTEYFGAGWVDHYQVWNYRFEGATVSCFKSRLATRITA